MSSRGDNVHPNYCTLGSSHPPPPAVATTLISHPQKNNFKYVCVQRAHQCATSNTSATRVTHTTSNHCKLSRGGRVVHVARGDASGGVASRNVPQGRNSRLTASSYQKSIFLGFLLFPLCSLFFCSLRNLFFFSSNVFLFFGKIECQHNKSSIRKRAHTTVAAPSGYSAMTAPLLHSTDSWGFIRACKSAKRVAYITTLGSRVLAHQPWNM